MATFVRITITVFAILNFISVRSQQTVQKFVLETNYLLSLPDHYNDDTTKRWPLLLFLHGSGESGSDVQKVKAHGPPQLADQGKKFPFIIVSPQSPAPAGWDAELLYKLLQNIKTIYRVDNQRIYLTGLSMGGYGTWDLAMKHPDEFAAIAPVCGGGDTTTAWKLRNISIWCFHGAKDDVVLPINSMNMVKAVKRYNPSVKFTLYPDANHNSWDSTYNSNDNLYNWLLAQKKFVYKEIPQDINLLKKYEGHYVDSKKNTVKIIANAAGLVVIAPVNDTIPFKAAGENLFFIDADRTMDLYFTKSPAGITGFIFRGNDYQVFRKSGK